MIHKSKYKPRDKAELRCNVVVHRAAYTTSWQYMENNIMLLHVRSVKRVMAVFYIYATTRALTPHIPLWVVGFWSLFKLIPTSFSSQTILIKSYKNSLRIVIKAITFRAKSI